MAGTGSITTTSCSLNPVPCRPAAKTTPSSLALSSFDSKLFGLRIRNPTIIKFNVLISLSSTIGAPITARYGGGSRYSGPYPRRSRQSDSDDEQALDISSIRSDSVRLIDEQQNMVGVVSKAEALQMADDADLDLVILSPDADPPVVRIMDYNYNIDQHDYSVRLKSARKFLKDGDKVKVIVNLKGRENEFRNFAIELIRRFQNDIGELATEEAKNFKDRNILIVLVPNKAVLQKAQEPPKKKDNKAEAVDEVSASV
ncbi:Translation initiation factor [Parasponia andersonii]|uniref:Translation initiation factor n=1 Tax=Parasponia andersonii TaxID=3476 RepID=A0A2P5DAX4_PARAD|nr:Translation initiation factor [Parasponia andersonii]